MEEDENDLENIFEEYENDNGPEAPLNNESNNNDGANDTQTAERVPVPRRAVKNPRLKFNAERLCGERGIPVLINHFKNVKFKGKGHEVEDLNKLMSTLEHWCHRLYPSMKLDDCLRQIEKLGKKRPVQTCLRKIRLDMPILSSDFIHEEDNDETEMDIELPPQDAFDRLINETQLISTPIVKTPAPIGQSLGTYSSTLTEEQKKKMEYNKLLAIERRKSKLASMQSSELYKEKTDLNDTTSKELVAMDEYISSNTVNKNEEMETMADYISSNTVNKNEELETMEDYIPSNTVNKNEEMETMADYISSNTVNKNEELELDDLVDLVDEEDSV